METLKIIGLILLCEVILYYLFTCYDKWTTGFYPTTAEILNPFVSWREAHSHREWQKGYNDCQENLETNIRKQTGLKKIG